MCADAKDRERDRPDEQFFDILIHQHRVELGRKDLKRCQRKRKDACVVPGKIIDVDAGTFYNDPRYKGGGHAVTVTSVTKNKYGDVSGFYIADSNRGTSYYYAWQIQDAMRPFVDMNVTSQIIR